MKASSVEWSFSRSPELIVEAWSVSATIEAVLRVMYEERKEEVDEILLESAI